MYFNPFSHLLSFIGAFNPLIFKVIIDKYVLIDILLIVFIAVLVLRFMYVILYLSQSFLI